MSYFATVNGASIIEGSLLIPQVGIWTADVFLAADTAINGPVPVTIGNLTLQGTSFRSQSYGGQTRARLVGGAGGWRNEIVAQGYGAASGVLLSTVLRDAATACGEQISIASDLVIGTAYARAADIASDMLWQLLSQGLIASWYVDQNGVTQTKAWPSTTINTPFTVTSQNPDEGTVEIATEDYASWMPGCSFTNPLVNGTLTNLGVHYLWGKKGDFRFVVMTGADNLTASFDAVVQKQIAPTRYHGRYEYTVTNPSTTTIDCEPVDPSIGLPSLQNVPLTGDSISSYDPPEGATCHIMFLNGWPTKPVCVWTAGNGTKAGLLGGGAAVARVGDTITITQAQLTAASAQAGGSPVTISPTPPATGLQGTITSGSSLVNSA